VTDKQEHALAPACPQWLGADAQKVWDRLPDVTHLVYANPGETIGVQALAELIDGSTETLDDIHDDMARRSAGLELYDTCSKVGVNPGELTIDEYEMLIDELRERDASETYHDQCVRNIGPVTVLVSLPALGSSEDADMATLLGLKEPMGEPGELGGAGDALCHLRAGDLLALVEAADTDIVTLPVRGVGTFDPWGGGGWLDEVPDDENASLVITVSEFRSRTRLDGRAGSEAGPPSQYTWWRTCGGFRVPPSSSIPPVVAAPAPTGPAGDTYLSLVADGWSVRDAVAAANALHAVNPAAAAPELEPASRVVALTRAAPGADNPHIPTL
jgi:hypothetical protein